MDILSICVNLDIKSKEEEEVCRILCINSLCYDMERQGPELGWFWSIKDSGKKIDTMAKVLN